MLVDVEKTLKLVLAEVDGVAVGLGDVFVVVCSPENELEKEDVSAGGLVLDAGAAGILLVVVVVFASTRLLDVDDEGLVVSDEALALASVELEKSKSVLSVKESELVPIKLSGSDVDDNDVEGSSDVYEVVTKYSVVIPSTTTALFLNCANCTLGEKLPGPPAT